MLSPEAVTRIAEFGPIVSTALVMGTETPGGPGSSWSLLAVGRVPVLGAIQRYACVAAWTLPAVSQTRMVVMCTGLSKCTSLAVWTFVLPLIALQLLDERFTEPSLVVFQFDWSHRTSALATVASERSKAEAAAMSLV